MRQNETSRYRSPDEESRLTVFHWKLAIFEPVAIAIGTPALCYTLLGTVPTTDVSPGRRPDCAAYVPVP